jgi:iron complex transport system ATP-binding protein
MLSVDGVTIERDGRTLLDDVHLDIQPGRVTAILGPNGAGKSSLIKVMSGEWRPQSGAVRLDGTPLVRLSANMLAQRRAVVAQSTSLSFPFTVAEVVGLGISVPGFALVDPVDRVADALADVALEGFEQRLYPRLSGGERQRVHIARAICQLITAPVDRTSLLLLYEPTSNLDPAHQAIVLDRMQQLAGYGWMIVVVLHDLNLAAAWADEVVLMRAGRIFAKGAAASVMTSDHLSAVYGCRIVASAPPEPGSVYVLPHHTRSRRTTRV